MTIVSRAKVARENIRNVAVVVCNETDWNIGNNVANKTVDVVDLPAINKTASDYDPYYHDEILYNLTITNTGTTVYENELTVVDSLPKGLVFIGVENVIGVKVVSFDKSTLTWVLTGISPDVPAVITLRFRVTEVGNLTNNLTLTGPEGTEKTVNCTVDVQPIVDLSVIVDSDKDEYFVDDIATWTIVVHNAGNGTNATGVNLNEYFPSDFFDIIEFNTLNGTYDNATGVWEIGFMGNGTDATLTIKAVAKTPGTAIPNGVYVSGNEDEWDLDNNFDDKLVDIVDLPAINKTVSNMTPYYHDEILYNLTITNTGTTLYENEITVVDSLPKGLEFIGVEGIVGVKVVSFDKSTLTWVLTGISPDAPAVITLRFRVTEIGNLTNNLTLIGPEGTEKTANCTVDVQPIIDLSVVKTADKDVYFLGDIVVWTVTVHNAGNGTNATDVTLLDAFPARNFEFLYALTDKGTYYENINLWDIGFMGNGTDATLYIVAYANKEGNDVKNRVMVSSIEDEWDLDNNYNESVVDVVDLPAINKTVSDERPHYHDEILYNLTITNNGPVDYTSVLFVVDSLPDGLEFIRTEGIVGADEFIPEEVDGQTITWYLTNITPDEPAVITVRVRVTEVGNFTNNLTVYTIFDHNKTVDCTVEAQPFVDVSTTITSDQDVYFVDDVAVWTITVHNAGNGTNATGVVLDEFFPFQYFEYIISWTENGTYDDESRVWDIGFMGNGTDATLYIFAYAKAPGEHINNRVVVGCEEDDWNLWNNFAYNYVDVVDLPVINKTVSDERPHYHDEILYNLTITNNGPVDYTNVLTVVDSLPDGLEFIRTENITGASLVLPEEVYGQSIVWYLTNITPDEPAVITVRVRVTDVGNFTNNLTVFTSLGNSMSVDCTVEAQPLVDVSTNITSNKDVYFAGDVAIWTITVHNAGNGTNATGVVLDEFFPFQYFEYIGFMTNNGTYDNESRVWDIGFMGNGTDATLYIYAYAKAPGEHINNRVVVACEEDDWNLWNNFAYNYVDVLPRPVPEKIVENPNPMYNDEILYYLKVTNVGNITYGSPLIVDDNLPEGLEFIRTVSITGADVLINETVHEQNIFWVITNISADEPAVITVLVKVNALGSLTNNLTIITRDGTLTKVNCTVEPVPFADLEVINIVSNKSVRKGDTVTWNITVVNHGPNLSENVYVKDILPEGLIFVSADGDYDPETGIWTIGDLDVGESVSLVIVSIANITNATITDIAIVNSTTYDPDMSNNIANNTTGVPPEADIGVVKEVDAKECVKDQIVVWTITMSNYGPDGAENVLVKDNLPDTLIFISADGDYDPETGIWTIDYLASGETRVLHIITKVNTTNQVIVNNVTATSGTYDPNMKNNKADNSTVVLPEADLAITIVPDVTNVKVGDKVQYNVTVVNLGPDAAVNTLATIVLPDELKLLDFKPSRGTYDPETGIWTIGDLAPGEKITLLIDTEALVAGKVVVNASVVSDTYESDLSNNNDSAEITVVEPEADLAITIEPDVTNVKVGDKVQYKVTVVNHGPDTAVNTRAVIELPKELKLLGFKPSRGTYDPETGIWTIGDLAPGEEVTLLLDTEALASGKIVVKVSVESDTYESDLSNNNDSAEITVEEVIVPPEAEPQVDNVPTMHATGNPIAMVLLALIALAGAALRRKN